MGCKCVSCFTLSDGHFDQYQARNEAAAFEIGRAGSGRRVLQSQCSCVRRKALLERFAALYQHYMSEKGINKFCWVSLSMQPEETVGPKQTEFTGMVKWFALLKSHISLVSLYKGCFIHAVCFSWAGRSYLIIARARELR